MMTSIFILVVLLSSQILICCSQNVATSSKDAEVTLKKSNEIFKDSSDAKSICDNNLICAVESGNFNVLKKLLLMGCEDINSIKNEEGQTAIHLASILGYDDILDMLLTFGGDPNRRDDVGLSPIHYAAIHNRPYTIIVLLLHDADPNIQEPRDGNAPLHFTAMLGHLEATKALIEPWKHVYPRSHFEDLQKQRAKENKKINCELKPGLLKP